MKGLKTSFLFIYLLLFVFNNLRAQKLIDSLDYYGKLINNPKKADDLSIAYVFFRNCKDSSLKSEDVENAIHSFIQIARIENKLGNIYDSKNSIIQALILLDDLKVSDWVLQNRVTIYNHLGLINKKQLNYKKALENYNNVICFTKNELDVSKAYGNKGNIYSKLEEHKKSIKEYKKALEICLRIDKPQLKARLLDNLGLAQSKLNHPKALSNMLEALDLRKEKKFSQGIITSYLNLTEYYSDRDSINKAKFYAEQALNIADSSNIFNYKMAALNSVLKLNKDPRFKEFIILNDSLKITNLLNNNKYAAEKYNYEKKEKELKESELNNEKQKWYKLLYLTIVIFVFLLAIFLYFLLKSKHKKDKLQQVYNTETRISKKVHDEVANDVYQVMTKLQSEPKISESLIDNLDQIYSKTRDISKEHSILDFKAPFHDILNDLLLSYNTQTTNVVAKDIVKVDWNALSEIKKITIYKVLQEFMINMKKHSAASMAVVTFAQHKRKITITYSDNGIGSTIKKNTGLQNVENRMQSIKGTVTFESEINKGFKAKMTV